MICVVCEKELEESEALQVKQTRCSYFCYDKAEPFMESPEGVDVLPFCGKRCMYHGMNQVFGIPLEDLILELENENNRPLH